MFNRSASSFLLLGLSLSEFNTHSNDRPVAGIDCNLVDVVSRNDDDIIDEKGRFASDVVACPPI